VDVAICCSSSRRQNTHTIAAAPHPHPHPRSIKRAGPERTRSFSFELIAPRLEGSG